MQILTHHSISYLFIEYATSAGHYKNMCTHRNEKRHKTVWKKAYTYKNTIKSKTLREKKTQKAIVPKT